MSNGGLNINFELWNEAYSELTKMSKSSELDRIGTMANKLRNLSINVPAKSSVKNLSADINSFANSLYDTFCASNVFQNYYNDFKKVNSEVERMRNENDRIYREAKEVDKSSPLTKFAATTAMVGLNLLQGAGKFFEDTVDGAATLVGAGCALLGFKSGSEAIGKFVEKEIVNDKFEKSYKNGLLKWVNDNSVYKYDSTAAKVIKGVGYAGAAIVTSRVLLPKAGASLAKTKVGQVATKLSSSAHRAGYRMLYSPKLKSITMAANKFAKASKVGSLLRFSAKEGIYAAATNGITALGATTSSELGKGSSFNSAVLKGFKSASIDFGLGMLESFTGSESKAVHLDRYYKRVISPSSATKMFRGISTFNDGKQLVDAAVIPAIQN